jgi:hypothetical protein
MYNEIMFSGYQSMWSGNTPSFMNWLLPFVILDAVLRGFALWKSARKGQNWWFVALLVVNSLGILPGIYLLLHKEAAPEKKKKISK